MGKEPRLLAEEDVCPCLLEPPFQRPPACRVYRLDKELEVLGVFIARSGSGLPDITNSCGILVSIPMGPRILDEFPPTSVQDVGAAAHGFETARDGLSGRLSNATH